MCGFAGFLGLGVKTLADKSDYKKMLIQMTDKISHRGPDDADCWVDLDSQVGFGHRRLSILDLTIAGRQPMVSGSGRYVIIFNGEIYNHLLLRRELETLGKAPVWRGYSDTETLLAGFDAWGIQETIERTVGMFAFALWCKQTRVLTLGRDRMGEKPLYYGWQGSGRSKVFLFGSEFKALQAHPAFVDSINRDAVCLFMRHSCIPAPYSIYKGIFKLLPGHLLSVSLEKQDLQLLNYWSGAKIVLSGVAKKFDGTSGEAIDSLEFLLKESVKQQMVRVKRTVSLEVQSLV